MTNSEEIVTLEISDVAYGGDGVGHLESGLTVFVPFTAVGDQITARIVQHKKSFARAELVEILKPGRGRTQPLCQYYGACGGCQYQHLTPAEELNLKVVQLAETLRRLGPLEELPEVAPIITREPFGYRKKVVLHPHPQEKAYGYYSHDNETIVPVVSCPIAAVEISETISQLSPKDMKPAPLTLRRTDSGRVYRYYGKGPSAQAPWLREDILGQKLHVPLTSFTQVNDEINEALVRWLRTIMQQQTCELLLDLYCGTGMFALTIGQQAKKVIGIERDRESIRAAQFNAKKWELPHITFHSGRVERALPDLIAQHPDGKGVTVLLDPPRSGCEKEVMKAIGDWAPQRIVYISCNPTTLARDLKRLFAKTPYKLTNLALFDMFPQTAHFESVAILEK